LAPDPLVDPRPGGGIAHQPVARLQPIGDEIVDDAAALVEHGAVERRPGCLQARHVVGEQQAQPILRAAAGDVENGHVTDVEQPYLLAYGMVFLQLGAIVQRHLPAGEGHHACAGGDVDVIKRRASAHGPGSMG
jgi:hypothetical protein